MFKVARKIKKCRMDLLGWNKQNQNNSIKRIQQLKDEMEKLIDEESIRDWGMWHSPRSQLDITYKEERLYWCKKARIQWLNERDRNTQFFYAIVIQKRQKK